MSHQAKREYLKSIHLRYQESTRDQKKHILDEFCSVCGYTRKYAIRVLNGVLKTKPPKSGRRPTYAHESLLPALYWLWLKMGKINSKRMKTALPSWLPYTNDEKLTPELRALLLKMSASTIERLLKRARVKIKGISATRPSKRFMQSIPIQAKDWNVVKPGTLQADTVAHTHTTLEGSFANSITMTDIYSGWTENRAVWTKSAFNMLRAIEDIEKSLPFEIETFKSDSGTEFLNHSLVSYFKERHRSVNFVRSRPYRKNDNCYVEQKNFTHVRELFGYIKIDQKESVAWMNRIYKELWNPLNNFFLPSTKLLRKERIGSRIKKYFDQPKTPYQRIMECDSINALQKAKLEAIYKNLNPFELSDRLAKEIKLFEQDIRNHLCKAA